MPEKFNPLDPLGVIKNVKNQVDIMATSAGLPPTPSVPGLQQRTNEERAVVHRERFPGTPEPARGTGIARILNPLGLFNKQKTKVEDRAYNHDKGV